MPSITAEEQLTRALSRYSWDAGYPFWGGRAKADKKLLEGSEEESGGGSDGESNEVSIMHCILLYIDARLLFMLNCICPCYLILLALLSLGL